MLYGTVLRAPVEGSVPDKIDDAKAKAIPGVTAVIRLPHGVGVVAETRVGGVRGAPGADRVRHLEPDRRGLGLRQRQGHRSLRGRCEEPDAAARDWSAQGDARGEFQNAASMVEGEYRCDYAYHAQMEPLNAVASVSPGGDAVEIWAGTQSQTTATEAPAKLLGIPRDKVKLHDLLMGGGFGRRGNRDVDFIIDAVMLSKESGRPVKVMWTREDDVHNGRFRPLSAHYLRAGVRCLRQADGLASSARGGSHHAVHGSGALPAGGGKDGMVMAGTDLRGYDVPHQLVEQLYRDTGVRTNPLRGIGVTANKFATEAFMDEIARKRGIDPLAFRLELLKARRAPTKWSSAWRRWRTGAANATAARSGLPTSTIPAARSPASPKCRSTARAGQIKVHNFWCTIDCGVAVQPDNVIAQTESSIVYGLGLTLSERIIDQGRRGRAVELLRLLAAAHERRAGDAHRADPDRQPSDRRRPDGDAADRADDLERDHAAHRRAAAAHAVHPGPGEADTGIRLTKFLRWPRLAGARLSYVRAASAAFTRSGVIGNCRSRTPVAS